jgi:hypothetical protein
MYLCKTTYSATSRVWKGARDRPEIKFPQSALLNVRTKSLPAPFAISLSTFTGFVTCLDFIATVVRSLFQAGSPEAYRRGGWGLKHPPPSKFRSFDKAEPNSQFRGKYIRNNLIRIWASFICTLSRTPD